MKIIFSIILFNLLVVISACNMKDNSNNGDKIGSQGDLSIRRDSTILGFTLGMLEDSVHSRIKVLNGTNPDLTVNDGKIYYALRIENGEVFRFECNFDFHKNHLYEVILNIADTSINQNTLDNKYSELLKHYSALYGDADFKNIEGEDSAIISLWSDHNRDIYILRYPNYISIQYNDNYLMKEVIDEQNEKMKKESNK